MSSTDTLFILPQELLDTSAKLSLAFLSSDNIFLEAYILVKDEFKYTRKILLLNKKLFSLSIKPQ